jgi:dTDP-4-amino-4,6-dideoxygalactose transaminase
MPVHSALSLRALQAGVAGALGVGGESELCERLGSLWDARKVLLTDSGTSALTHAIRGAVGTTTRPVALPAYGCYDLATAAVGAGARVVLYDVDPETLAPVPESLRRAFAHGPAAVVVAHLYGIPIDTAEIRRLADGEGILLIEDAAQAVGGFFATRPVGGAGSVTVLSFGRGKGLTGGGGGALLCNDAQGDAIVAAAELRNGNARAGWSELARATAQWAFGRPTVYGIPSSIPFLRLGETVYHPPRPPRRIARSATRIVSAVWAASQRDAMVRRRNAERLNTAAQKRGCWRTIIVGPRAVPGYLRLPLLCASGSPAFSKTGERLGIMRGYALPLFALPALRRYRLPQAEGWPGATELADRLITLPTHARLSESDLAALEAWLVRPTFGT